MKGTEGNQTYVTQLVSALSERSFGEYTLLCSVFFGEINHEC